MVKRSNDKPKFMLYNGLIKEINVNKISQNF